MIFTVVYGVLLKPLPYPDPDRLVRLFEWSQSYPKFPVSILNYLEDRRQSRTLESIGLYTGADMELTHGERPERVTGVSITHDFFLTLGWQPMLRRNFLESELKRAARVVILGYTMWRSRFQSDPAVVGRTIRLNRENWTINGVLPPGFNTPAEVIDLRCRARPWTCGRRSALMSGSRGFATGTTLTRSRV